MLRLNIHPDSPQTRLINRVCTILEQDSVIVIPTDSCYALATALGNKSAFKRIQNIRQLEQEHLFSLLCKDVSNLSTFAKINNSQYRTLKRCTPGPYTFILKATRDAPKLVMQEKRNEIGIRIPDNKVLQAILEDWDAPLLSTTLRLPESSDLTTEADIIESLLSKHIDLLVNGGNSGLEPTTIINMIDEPPTLVRLGKGSADFLDV